MNEHQPRSGEAPSVGADMRDNVRHKAADLAQDAKQQARKQYERQKGAATGELDTLASALRRAGSELGDEHGTSSRVITTVADRIESFSRSLEGKDLDQVARDVESFARRNPAAFLGGAVALGFAASRFLKSGSSRSSGAGFNAYDDGGSGDYYTGSPLDRSAGTSNFGVERATERDFGSARQAVEPRTTAGNLPTDAAPGPATGVSGTIGSTGSVATPGTIGSADETSTTRGRGRR